MSAGPRSTPPDLPGFTPERWIGGGGFADVFLYTQHRPSRSVAIKILRSEHLSDAALTQFDAEADIMAEVSTHPFIVTIHASGTAPDGRPYIVMEHYPRPNFGERARGGTMELAEVLRTGIQVAGAVETAHRAGIIHRDIKPVNILTSRFGRPGLTDFGIAGVQTDGALSGAVGVTIPYTAPEVLDEASPGSIAADVYGLAATIAALASGHSPYWSATGENTDQAVLERVLHGRITPIIRPDAPGSLSHLLTQAMSHDPDHRPTSALVFARSLQQIEQELRLQPTPIEVAPTEHELRPRTGDGDHDDRTRRSIQVVDPFGGPTPPTGAPKRAVIGKPSAPVPSASPTGPTSTRPSVRPPHDTPVVASSVPPVAGTPMAPPPTRSASPVGTSPMVPTAPAPSGDPETEIRARARTGFAPPPVVVPTDVAGTATPAPGIGTSPSPSTGSIFTTRPTPDTEPSPSATDGGPAAPTRRLDALPWKPIGAVAALIAIVTVVAVVASSGARNSKAGPGETDGRGGLVQPMPTGDASTGSAVTPTDVALSGFTASGGGDLTASLTWTPVAVPGTELAVRIVPQHAPPGAGTTVLLDATSPRPVTLSLTGPETSCTGVRFGDKTLPASYCRGGPPCLEVTAQRLHAGTGDPIAVGIDQHDTSTDGGPTDSAVDPAAYDHTCSVTLSGEY